MEQLDIIVLTSVMATAFIIFIVATCREFIYMSKNSFNDQYGGGKEFKLLTFTKKLVENKNTRKKRKKVIYDAIFDTIADMESDGVYFPEEVKKELLKQREELTCHYSGLPSTISYESSEK